MPNILIIDDEPPIRRALKDVLEFEKYVVEDAADGLEGLVKIKQKRFDVILLDVKMPKMDGMEALDRIQEITPETPVVMISGHGTIETAVEAVKKGAFDFIAKPLDLNRLLITIRNALDKGHLMAETRFLKKQVAKSKVQDIIGVSGPIQRIKDTIQRVGPTEARVLITGPNGSGKELIARWLHEQSNRSANPIVEVNCAAIPSELIESELFGHEKGAFTSAIKQRLGKFEQANGGTLFLDEIGDMSLSAQAKVLRALQENRITRVGGDKDVQVDVRIIAATNKNLREEIEAGRFREDLYHRLAVIIIQSPALNDRREDIPLLVDHFNRLVSEEYGVAPKPFSEAALKALFGLNWTGNIRELRNVVERLIILSGNSVELGDVENFVFPSSAKAGPSLQSVFQRFDDPDDLHAFIGQEFLKFKNNGLKVG